MTNNLIDVSGFSYATFQAMAKLSEEDRIVELKKATKTEFTPQDVQRIEPMSFSEELAAVLFFLFGVPGSVFSLPVVAVLMGYFVGNYRLVFTFAAILAASLAFGPAPFLLSSLNSWIALQMLRYFSFKGIFAEPLSSDRPYILVAPPHGVFPFGNILTMLAFPSLAGYDMKGLGASAVFRTPVFKQLLSAIGVEDASRSNATRLLKAKHTVGISTGGVAEIFETDLSPHGNEVIVLQSRKGLVRLAFRTGAALVPCYLFGNTHLLSLWCGGSGQGKQLLQRLSRRIGFGIIAFWGRFFLPIPYRVPIVGAMGKPIEVPQKDEPTDEEVDHYHKILLEQMALLFDTHKAAYGWEHKQLIIQ